MTQGKANDGEFHIRNLVEQLFLTSATDEQLKIRLVKNIQSLLERRELEARIEEVSTALNAYDPSQPSYVLKTIGEHLTKRLTSLRSERQAGTGEAPNVPLSQ